MLNLEPILPDFSQQPAPQLGLEIEMFGFDSKTLAPLGSPEARVTPQQLMERLPGTLKTDSVTGVIIGLDLACGNFSLEPGGQLEYATCPHATLQGVLDDLHMGLQLLEEAGQQQVLFLDHGTNPLAGPDLPLLVPKHRYRILDRYFASQPQGRGVHMMRYSATAQPNIDIIGQEAWQDAVNLTLALTPLVRQLFANSCYFQGRKVQHSERQRIWQAIDPTRTGIPPIAGQADIGAAYASWAERANVFLVGDLPLEEQPLYGQLTYQQWQQDGYKGAHPTDKDWRTHLATLFPDLRLRKFLEVRMVDAQPFQHALAPMAFWATALHHGRDRIWHFLKQPGTPVQLLQTVLEAAPDELSKVSLQAYLDYLKSPPTYPDSPLDFVRQQATTHPSRQILYKQ